MKKIMIFSMTLVFALALGSAYANEGGKVLDNGITDFRGGNYDTFPELSPAVIGAIHSASAESSNAGGPRSSIAAMELNNGVTDFVGGNYDTFPELSPAVLSAMHTAAVEGSHAGGPRSEKSGKAFSNGITDFVGGNYDIL